jgi:hypothetical protein
VGLKKEALHDGMESRRLLNHHLSFHREHDLTHLYELLQVQCQYRSLLHTQSPLHHCPLQQLYVGLLSFVLEVVKVEEAAALERVMCLPKLAKS